MIVGHKTILVLAVFEQCITLVVGQMETFRAGPIEYVFGVAFAAFVVGFVVEEAVVVVDVD